MDFLPFQEARSLKAGELSQQESKNLAHTNMKVTTDKFSSEKTAMESQQQRQTVTASGIFNQKEHSSASSHVYTTSSRGLSASATSKLQASSRQVRPKTILNSIEIKSFFHNNLHQSSSSIHTIIMEQFLKDILCFSSN